MANTIAHKLKIKEGYRLVTLNAPKDFEQTLAPLPDGVKILKQAKVCDQVHWFVKNKAELERDLEKVLPLVKEHVVCWIYYPKGSSKIQTDLSREKGWDALLAHQELRWISLISFDETWSTFGFRLKTAVDRQKDEKPKRREVLDYIDAREKVIRLPLDLQRAFRKFDSEKTFFDTLSFTNRKEYVEWIVTAKREETRKDRINATIDRLGKGWKNPRNL